MSIKLASEVVPQKALEPGQYIEDIQVNDKYSLFDYRAGMLKDAAGHDWPSHGNTAFFNIRGRTEPVVNVKPEFRARYHLTVLAGRGAVVRAFPSGGTDVMEVKRGDEFDIMQGQIYSIVRLGSKDIVLRDEARPAFRDEDEIQVFSDDSVISERYTPPIFSRGMDGEVSDVYVPPRFFELLERVDPAGKALWL